MNLAPLKLSPLNFQGLIATSINLPNPYADESEDRPHAIECWRCSECSSVYDDEFDAEECCADKSGPHAEEGRITCPICAASATDHRDAADCCLWKDMDASTRWTMADKVEAGARWTDLLNVNRKDLTQ